MEVPAYARFPDSKPVGVCQRNVHIDTVKYRVLRIGLRVIELVQPSRGSQQIRMGPCLDLRFCPANFSYPPSSNTIHIMARKKQALLEVKELLIVCRLA